MNPNLIAKIALLASLTASLIACSSLERHRLDERYTPRGPGATFATLEAAVVDALAHARLEAKRTHTLHLLRGGTITRTDGGFTYGPLTVASPESPTRIEYALRPSDVARFHAYPRSSPSENMRNENPSRKDRSSVDDQDPLHRPVFVLTPRLLVKAYYGETQPVTLVADLGTWNPELLIAGAD
jgi:hypothetical protein